MPFDPQPFRFGPSLQHWGSVVLVCLAMVVVVGLLISLVLAGLSGPRLVWRQIAEGVRDFVHLSPRRVAALAMLTFREAMRRKALAVFGVFAVLFMFAGWFLSNANPDPSLQISVYISFVLTAITWLILPVLLLMSCWSIPEDVRNRSLHTVVTKPARRLEIVLGRMVGFGMLGTLLVLVMGCVSYVWVVRNFPAPTLDETLTAEDGSEYAIEAELTDRVNVEATNLDSGETLQVSGPDDLYVVQQLASRPEFAPIAGAVARELEKLRDRRPVLLSRVPLYGELGFLDREGNPAPRGVNTGDEWEFRTYIEGGTSARAIWLFENITPERLGDTLQFQSSFEAYRTHKGEMNRGLTAQFIFSKNLREQAAMVVAAPEGRFERLGRLVGDGDFASAGTELRTLADGLRKGVLTLTAEDTLLLNYGYRRFVQLIEPFTEKYPDWEAAPLLVEAAKNVSTAAGQRDTKQLATALERVGELFISEAPRLERELIDVRVADRAFDVAEYGRNVTLLPRRLPNLSPDGSEKAYVDIYDDLVHGGELRVEVACRDAGQFLGMARPDLFIRTPDRPFLSGFSKAIVSDWLKLMLVVIFGVTASCFLKGPVAALLTFAVVVLGNFFHEFMGKLISGELQGSGPIESLIHILQQTGPTVPLDEGIPKTIADWVDPYLLKGVEGVFHLIPDMSRYSAAEYVAHGFDVPWSAALLPAIMTTLAYFIPFLLLGYYGLKLRELEAK